VIWLDTLLYELIGKLMGLGLRACEQYMGQTSTVGLSRNYKDVRPWDKFAQQGPSNEQIEGRIMTVCILGAGAFGTALAVALSDRHDVRLWGRDGAALAEVAQSRKSPRLPNVTLAENITVTDDANTALQGTEFILCAIPLQATAEALSDLAPLFAGQPLIGCSKGMDLATGLGGYSVLRSVYKTGPSGVLTGPSFAVDIAKGLPTALTLAAEAQENVSAWQAALSTETLRLYTSGDPIGAELGGALKNVMAIACWCHNWSGSWAERSGGVDHARTGRNHPLCGETWRATRNFGGSGGLWRSVPDLHVREITKLSIWSGPWAGPGF
jgi:hypothetical protein